MSKDEFVSGIAYPSPFGDYAVRLCESARRTVFIASPRLDHAAFDSAEMEAALSGVARDSRQSEVRILLADTRAVVGRGHRLLELARRMPSCVKMHQLEEHPEWNNENVVIRDRSGVLYSPGSVDSDAFYEPDSRASTLRHIEWFESLWRYSKRPTELRALNL